MQLSLSVLSFESLGLNLCNSLSDNGNEITITINFVKTLRKLLLQELKLMSWISQDANALGIVILIALIFTDLNFKRLYKHLRYFKNIIKYA